MKAGILIETTSYCNTSNLPVIKADKNRWRLVHDLRAINEIVEDLPAEVPNLHTFLTNVPPEAKYFTVIDICSAYFSVLLAEESRYFSQRGLTLSPEKCQMGGPSRGVTNNVH